MKIIALMLIFFCFNAYAEDIHLICKQRNSDIKTSLSIYQQNGKRVMQQDSVINIEGVPDRDGGVLKIYETPAQFRMEYFIKTTKFTHVTLLNRLSGEMVSIVTGKVNGTDVSSNSILDCVVVKNKF